MNRSLRSRARTLAWKRSRRTAGSKTGEGMKPPSARKAPAGARTCRWGCQFKNSPAVWMETMAAGRASPPVSSRRNEERAFQTHRASLGRSLRRYRNAGRRTLGSAKTRCRWGTGRITCSRTNSAHRAARLAEQDGQNPRCLQEKATRYSFPQAPHRTRAKPPSGRPHPKLVRFYLILCFCLMPPRQTKIRQSNAKMSGFDERQQIEIRSIDSLSDL